ncbi:MAG: hypothetical protein RR951_07555 [Ruthenibacterium sp.]
MDNKNIEVRKRNYDFALLILAGVMTGGTLWCTLRPSAWAFFFLPLLGAVATALVWVLIARFVLCRDPRRLLAKSFKAPIKYALIMPVWFVCTLLLSAVPSDTSAWDEELAGIAAALVLMLCVPAALLCTLIFGALSIYKGYAHWKTAPQTETRLYREAPFAVSVLLFALVMGLLIFSLASGLF